MWSWAHDECVVYSVRQCLWYARLFSGVRAILCIEYITKSSVTITKYSVEQLITAIYSSSNSNYGYLDVSGYCAQLFYFSYMRARSLGDSSVCAKAWSLFIVFLCLCNLLLVCAHLFYCLIHDI